MIVRIIPAKMEELRMITNVIVTLAMGEEIAILNVQFTILSIIEGFLVQYIVISYLAEPDSAWGKKNFKFTVFPQKLSAFSLGGNTVCWMDFQGAKCNLI